MVSMGSVFKKESDKDNQYINKIKEYDSDSDIMKYRNNNKQYCDC